MCVHIYFIQRHDIICTVSSNNDHLVLVVFKEIGTCALRAPQTKNFENRHYVVRLRHSGGRRALSYFPRERFDNLNLGGVRKGFVF